MCVDAVLWFGRVLLSNLPKSKTMCYIFLSYYYLISYYLIIAVILLFYILMYILILNLINFNIYLLIKFIYFHIILFQFKILFKIFTCKIKKRTTHQEI